MTFVAAVCESCLEKRLEEERRSQLVYSRAAIYVRQVDKIGALTDNLTDAPSASAFSSSVAEDPDFQVTPFFLPLLRNTRSIDFQVEGMSSFTLFPHPFQSWIGWRVGI